MKQEIHISDVRNYLQCRRKWDWSSPLRQNLERKVTYSPFFLGRGVHACLQYYYEHGRASTTAYMDEFLEQEVNALKSIGSLWENEEQEIQEQSFLMRGMLEHYQQWAPAERGLFADENLEFIAMEQEVSVPIPSPSGRASSRVYLKSRFDGLVRRKDDGSYWILETKTAGRVESLLKTLDNDIQCGVYAWAAGQVFNVRVSGVLYNVLRKKVPTEPAVLQNGTLSKRKDIDTTAMAYLSAIRRQHPEWDNDEISSEYGDILQHLITQNKQFFYRQPIIRTPAELANLMEDIHYIALEMVRPSTRVFAAPSWASCNFCPFRAPCIAKNAGGDYESIINSEFRVRRGWDPLEGSEKEADNGSWN